MFDLQRVILSFIVGGLICVAAQILIDLTRLTPARILVLYVCVGAFIGALGFYEPIFDTVGAGISVPLVGFGGNVATGVKGAIDESGAIGILTGPFTAASAGCSSALIFGYLCALLFKGKPKRA